MAEFKIATTVDEIVSVYTHKNSPQSCMWGWSGYEGMTTEWKLIGHPTSYYGLCENTAVAYGEDKDGITFRSVLVLCDDGKTWYRTSIYRRYDIDISGAGGTLRSYEIQAWSPTCKAPKFKGFKLDGIHFTYRGVDKLLCPCPSFDVKELSPDFLSYEDGVFTFSNDKPVSTVYRVAPSTSYGLYSVTLNNPTIIRRTPRYDF